MKTFLNTRNQNYKLTKNLTARIANAVFIMTALFAVTAQIVSAQATRIPTPGAGGNFGDIQVDGDRVKILSSVDGGATGKIRIRLDADNNWWKRLLVIDKNGVEHSIEQRDGRYWTRVGGRMNNPDQENARIEIASDALNDTFKLQYWKAKFLGVPTHVMTETYRKGDFVGSEVTFNWREGLEDGYSDEYEDATAPIDNSFKIDGKEITIKSSAGGKAGYATVKFNTDVDWWTGVKMFQRSGKAWLIDKEGGIYNPATRTIRLPINSLPSEIKLEFWTAKGFGVHTHMATRKFIKGRFDGRVITINWGAAPAAPIDETIKIDGRSVTIRSSAGRSGYVTIKFQASQSWWSGIRFFDRRGKAWLITHENGRYSPSNRTLTILTSSLPQSTVKLELWKAKLFGVHTHMTSKTYATERLDGRTITINSLY